jgi:flagellar hook-associated protein 2
LAAGIHHDHSPIEKRTFFMSSSSALNTLLGSTTSTGLDISSLLQAALGASSSGIDVTAAVNAAVTAARAPESAWQAQQTALQSQITAINQLQVETTNLQNDLVSLNNLIGPLAARTVTSSNPSILTGSVSPGSSVGNHSIVVNALATSTAWASTPVGTASTVLGSGSFSITSADGTVTKPDNRWQHAFATCCSDQWRLARSQSECYYGCKRRAASHHQQHLRQIQ